MKRGNMASLLGLTVLVLGVVTWTACGGGSGGGGGDDDGGGTIASNEQAMASIPSTDPTSLDYALTSAGSAMIAKALGVKEGEGEGGQEITHQLKIVHTPAASGLGNFKASLCREGAPLGYASYDVSNDVFSGNLIVDDDDDGLNLTSSVPALAITDESFIGGAKYVVQDGANIASTLVIGASGATDTNTLQGAKLMEGGTGQVACQWNASLGCGSFQSPAGVGGPTPFAISVDAATKEKSYSETADQSMCSNMPAFISVETPAALPAGMWDCQVPADATAIAVASAVDLENNGGPGCVAASGDFWETFDEGPDECFGGALTDAQKAGCMCDALYGMGSRIYRQWVLRRFLCKVKAVFALKDQLGVALGAGEVIYLNIAAIGGGGGEGGGGPGGGGGGGGDEQVDGCYCTALCTNMDASPAPDETVAACNACCAAGTGVEACLTGVCNGNQDCLNGVAQACP